MAATAPASVTDSYTVPDWVERNSQIFKCSPPVERSWTGPDSRVKRVNQKEQDAARTSLFKTGSLDAGVSGAVLTDDGMGTIDLPTGPQPADYWRNVENHGNILVTFIATARRKSGFIPALNGTEFTKEQADEYARKFSAWMNEIDSYEGYVQLVNCAQQTSATNDTTDCNVILKGVSDFVIGAAGLAGGLAETVAQRITSFITSAANYATQHGRSVNVGFSVETMETTGTMDPIQRITYASTIMSKTQNGKTVCESSEVTMASFVYRLNSAAIISWADQLATRCTVTGAKQYRDYVNAPLNAFEGSR